MQIHPAGYLYNLADYEEKDCFIGFEKIPDDLNHFRIGTVFLRNFYVGLDYEENMILIGVNKGSSDVAKAGLDGRSFDTKHMKGTPGWALALILTILVILFVCAAAFRL